MRSEAHVEQGLRLAATAPAHARAVIASDEWSGARKNETSAVPSCHGRR